MAPTRVRLGGLLLLSLLLLTMLVATPRAASTGCIINSNIADYGACVTAALPLAALGILVSLLFVAMAYMFGQVFNFEGLRGWYKNELKETAKSIIIIATIFSIIVIVSGVASALAQPYSSTSCGFTSGSTSITTNLGNVYNVAECNYIEQYFSMGQSSAGGIAPDAYNYLVGVAYGVGFLKGLSGSLWFPIPFFVSPPPVVFIAAFQFGTSGSIFVSSVIESSSNGRNLAFLADAANLVVIPTLIIFEVQYYMLPSIIAAGLLLFIPAGVILRAVPIARPIGGSLLAIGIALSIVYPTTLVALNLPITNFIQQAVPNVNASSSCNFNNAWLNLFACPFVSLLQTLSQYSSGINAGLSSQKSIYPVLNGTMYYIFPLVVQFLLFIIDIIVIVTITQNIAELLGGKVRLGLGKRFKLA